MPLRQVHFHSILMRETLIVIGLLILAVGLRSARTGCLRKLGALTFLAASFCLLYFLTGSLLGGLLGAVLWFFLPWIELLTRIRRMRLPLNNRLHHRRLPDPRLFPDFDENLHQSMRRETELGMQTLASQHGGIWVSLGLAPSNAKASTSADLNHLGGSVGLMVRSPSDAGVDEIPTGDLASARHYGERVAGIAARLKG